MLTQVRACAGVLSGVGLRQLRVYGDHDDVNVYGAALWCRNLQRDTHGSSVGLLHRDAIDSISVRSCMVVGHGLLLRSYQLRTSQRSFTETGVEYPENVDLSVNRTSRLPRDYGVPGSVATRSLTSFDNCSCVSCNGTGMRLPLTLSFRKRRREKRPAP